MVDDRRGSSFVPPVYDAFFKGLMGRFYEQLFKVLLGFEVVKLEVLEVELTSLRVQASRVDYLARVEYRFHGEVETRIIQVEFQATNDPSMGERMLGYSLDIKRIYFEYPTQVVIYFGEEPLKMPDRIHYFSPFSSLEYMYTIIDISQMDPGVFLESEELEINFLALWSKASDKEKLLETLLLKVKEQGSRETINERFTILELVSKKRRLTSVLYQKVREMFSVEEIEELATFKMGEERGIEKGRKETLRENIIQAVRLRFKPSRQDMAVLKKRVNEINNKKILEKLFQKAITSDTYTDFLKEIKMD